VKAGRIGTATPGPTVFIYHAMSQGRELCTLNTQPDKGVSLTATSNPYLMTEHLQDMIPQRTLCGGLQFLLAMNFV
jgi:hypothetical protein